MMTVWTSMPDWAQLLVQGISLLALMAACAVAASRAGRSPYWALCAIIPQLVVILIWAFAFCEWPLEKKEKRNG